MAAERPVGSTIAFAIALLRELDRSYAQKFCKRARPLANIAAYACAARTSASHSPVNLRRNFGRLDLAPATPEDVRVGDRNVAACEVSIDRCLVLEEQRFVGAVRDRHDVDVAKFRPRLAPITMRQNLVPPDFAARFHLAARRHGPMEKRVETRHPHAASRRLHMLEKSGEPADDLALRQVFRDSQKIRSSDTPASSARASHGEDRESLPA